MAITSEDGTGITGAEMYGTVAAITTYWQVRPGTLSDAWFSAYPLAQEGGAREAAQYMDAEWGPFYIGVRKTQAQGRLWPRVSGLDDDGEVVALTDALGNELPTLPAVLLSAQAELAARAVSGPLADDAARGGRVRRVSEAVGPLREETEYFDGAPSETRYGVVAGILAPILNGSQPGAGIATWYWR